MSDFNNERMLTEAEAAELLSCTKYALRAWRNRRVGPPFYKVGGRLVRYKLSELKAFAETNRVEPGGAA